MKKALILGAGFAGCTIAHLLNKNGWDCIVVEKENVIGGGCRTFFYGGHPYTKGPRPYYGYSEKIFRWVDSLVKMRRFPHYLLSYIEEEKRFFSYPIHEKDLPLMSEKKKIYEELKNRDLNTKASNFEEYWISRVGLTLYDMFVNKYSKKMWMIDSNKEIDTFSWSAKDDPISRGSKECYPNSVFGYPAVGDGYNSYFEKTIMGSRLILNENVRSVDLKGRSIVLSDGTRIKGDVLISSIPLEELCNYSCGKLLYAGRDFIVFVLPCKQAFPDNIRFCHYTGNEPYTRIVEYKKLTFHEADDTLLILEIPSRANKLYPYMMNKYIETSKRYLDSLPDNVFSIGRLGTYKYSTIEQTISQCFSLFKSLTEKSIEGMENEFYNLGDISLFRERKTLSGEADVRK